MICPYCESPHIKTEVSERKFDFGFGIDETVLSAKVPSHMCLDCGFEFLDDVSSDAMQKAVDEHTLPNTPKKIAAIRKKYNLSRDEFARISRIGIATLGRWERGEKEPNLAYKMYLQLLDDPRIMEMVRKRGYTKDLPKPEEV